MNLVERAEAGDLDGVLRELEALTPEQRAAHAADLAARHEALSAEWRGRAASKEIVPYFAANFAAELGCQTTPEAAAACIMRNENSVQSRTWVKDVMNLYPVAWQAELVARLDEQEKPLHTERWFAIADHIVGTTGCPVPTSDAYINAWLSSGKLGPAQNLRDDVSAPVLLPLAVERPGVRLPNVETLAGLAADGVIDRGALVRRVFADVAVGDAPWRVGRKLEDLAVTPAEHASMAPERVALVERTIARLLQDGTRMATEGPLGFLRLLAPTLAEQAVFLRDYVAMLELSLPVATYGHEVLVGLDEAGLLESDVRTEASERVLLRPEKKLVRAQLSWLDRVARRDPARAGRVLVEAALVFQHRDTSVQERGLNLIARRLKKAGHAVLPELRTAAEGLSPAHAARAADLLGLDRGTGAEEYVEVLPDVPEPTPVPGPLGSAAEVAQEVAAVLANERDVVAFERALDGLVRHARRDRAALSQALEPVVRKEPRSVGAVCTQVDLYDVAVAVHGGERRGWHIHLRADHPAYNFIGGNSAIAPAGKMLLARLSEAIEVIEAGTQPFLLAVPTLATGALDAAVLVERIAEFEELGATPAPVDLAQALLRVAPAPGAQVQRAAEKLQSEAGQRLAGWLAEGGLDHQDSTPNGWPVSHPASAPPKRWEPAHPGVVCEPPLPPAAAALFGPHGSNAVGSNYVGPFWLAQLPHHRDEVAARMEDITDQSPVLPFLVESGGPAGFAVHWWIARFVVGGSRTAGADALLVLAARGQLDGRLLGGQVQAVLHCYGYSANRATDALRAAAETGAYATVWSVLEGALPGLLGDTPVKGAGALLALAVECAMRCGANGQIPEIEAVAGRKGSTQTIKNARLLRDALR